MLYSLREGFVLLDRERNIVWNNPQAAVNNMWPSLGDANGDGVLELLQFGAGMRVINITTGPIEWIFPGVGGTIEPIMADINNGGRDEVIVAANNTLTAVAYHKNDEGKILWKKSFPANIGAPAIAEIDGNMQIVVICEDGYVYGLGSSEQ